MKIGMAVRLNILCTTNAGIGHDGGATARFIGGRAIAVPATRASISIKRVIAGELVAHLVSYVINVERVGHRRG